MKKVSASFLHFYIVKKITNLEYDNFKLNENYIYAKKENDIYLLDSSNGNKLLNEKSYQAIGAVNYNGGRAMVYDGTSIQIVDINGNLIKNLIDIDSNQYVLAEDYYNMSGYQDETNAYTFCF